MFCGDGFRQKDEETFLLEIPENRDYKILQLTDLHLGFGLFSHKKDKMALDAVTKIINRTSPDLIVFTGDIIFPFLPKAGTMNNKKQAERFIRFIDRFKIPYTLVFGNHDCEMGANVVVSSLQIFLQMENIVSFQKEEKIYLALAISL